MALLVGTHLGAQPVSSLSHLLAAIAALIATIPLVRLGGVHLHRRLAVAIYAACVTAAMTASGVYHALALGGTPRMIMQRVDHCAIWFLIAGTFTAVHGVMWKGFWGRGVLVFVWSYALVGVLLQVFWFRTFEGNLGLALYLGLGWVGILSMYKLARQIGWAAVLPVGYAGFAYSAGAILEALGWPVLIERWFGAHELFHFAVVAGILLHWQFIRSLLIHHAPPLALPAGAEMVRSG
jgi:channel protein (hemolysin III family)